MNAEFVPLSIRNIKNNYSRTNYKQYINSIIGKKLEDWRKDKVLAAKKINKIRILKSA